jgi:isopentenyl phosphate kinase
MQSKVQIMMNLIEKGLSREIIIFSGLEPGFIPKVISGQKVGTRLYRND